MAVHNCGYTCYGCADCGYTCYGCACFGYTCYGCAYAAFLLWRHLRRESLQHVGRDGRQA
jgi:hypothetical protein